MKALFNIIWKNFKLLLRAKTSALVIFLGPLLVVTIIGAAFSNTGTYDVNIGVYSPSYSTLSNEILDKFAENNYQTIKFNSEQECINSVKTGKSNLCMLIPPDLNLQSSAEINFHVDYSEINLVYAVLDAIGGIIGQKSTEISEDLAGELLSKIEDAKSSADTTISEVSSMRTRNTDASSKIAEIRSELISIKIFDISNIPIDDISDNVEDIKGLLEDINNELEDAKDDIESLPDSVDRTSALSSINSALSDMEDTLNLVGDNETDDSLILLIIEADEDIANATDSLLKLKNQQDSSASDLSGVKTSLDSSIEALESIDAKNKDLKSSLGSLTVANAEKITTPIKTKVHSVVTESTYFNFIFSTLVVMIIMITSILLSSTLIMSEKKSKAFFRNYITPTKDSTFNTGMFLTSFMIISAQVIIFLAVSELFFGVKLVSSLSSSVLVLVLTASFFIALGMLIGYLFKSSETNTLASISISSLLLFLSSAVLPMESMPAKFRMIAGFNPFVIAETALRKTIFFNFNISQISSSIYLLILYTTVTLIITLIVQKALRHKILLHFHKKKK